jgi:predicted permease
VSLYLVKHLGPDSIPHLHETGLDPQVIGYALGITLITGLLFGLAPAVGATRMNMVEALKEGGQRTGGSATAPRIRNALLVTQVAMALVLVIAAGLLIRTFYSMLRSDAGFDAARVVTFELPLPTPKYADTGRMAQLYQQVLLRLQSVPGIQSAGLTSVVPMGGVPDGTVIRMPERPATNRSEQPYANYSFASPGYFATIGTPLLRGRDFTDADTLSSVPVTIITSSMAKRYFHGEDPIGKQVGVATTKIPVRTIIGVVANIKHTSLREEPDPEMFVPYTQNEIRTWPSMQTMQFAVRTRTDQIEITESVRQAVHAVDPELPVAKFTTLARDWRTYRARRATRADLCHDPSAGRSSCNRRNRNRPDRGSGCNPLDDALPLWGSAGGPNYICCGVSSSSIGRFWGLLRSGPQGDESGSDDRPALRVVRRESILISAVLRRDVGALEEKSAH